MKYLSFLFFGLILACTDNSNKVGLSPENLDSALGITNSSEFVYSGDEERIETVQIAEKKSASREQQIIKSARLTFETKEPDTTHRRILKLAKQYEGIVQNDASGKSHNRISRMLTIRVPTQNFQGFIDGVSEGVHYFDEREIAQKDVTEEFVDLEARLRAKRELEERYLELLKMAKNVKEVLEVERQLAIIREEIEAKQGRLNYLQDRVAMSTIIISFYKQTADTGITVSYGQKMKNAFRGGWNGVSVFFLGILYLWPLLLLGIILILVVRYYLKRNRAKAVR